MISEKHTITFHAFIICNERYTKLVIDEGSNMSEVSKAVVDRLNLKVESHPKPFRVAWFNRTTLPVIERHLIPNQMGDYEDEVHYDVLPMDIAHIFLGHQWFYYLNVTNHAGENTYIFKYN